MSRQQLSERIRRLLLLVPTAAASKDGVPLDALAERLGISAADLEAELDFLLFVGRPPFSPADLLDLYVEGDRLYVDLPQNLVRPPRLTHDEALALAFGARMLLAGDPGPWGETLGRVLARVEDAMNPTEKERYQKLEGRIVLGGDTGGAVPGVHAVLQAAATARQGVSMTYYSASSDRLGEREVHPYGLIQDGGRWYLAAGPEGDRGYKIFRLDRIREVAAVGEPEAFEVPADFELEGARPRPRGGATARVRITGPQARYVKAEFGDLAEKEDRESVVVTFETASWDWVSAWTLAFGGAAEVLEPEGLRAKVADDARRTLAHLASRS